MNDKTSVSITVKGHEVKPLSTWVTKGGEVVFILDVEPDNTTFPIRGALYWCHNGPGLYSWRPDGKTSTGSKEYDLRRPATIHDAIFARLGIVGKYSDS